MKTKTNITNIFFAITFFVVFLNIFFYCKLSNSKENNEEFRVGMEANYPPFNWTQNLNSKESAKIQDSNQFAGGYDVMISNSIAAKLNKKLIIVKTEWDGLIPALISKKIDAIVAGMSPTQSRKEIIDFSDNYYVSDLVILVKKGSKYENAKNLHEFCNSKITAQLNTLHYKIIDQIPNVYKQKAMENFPSMRVALESGIIDGYVTEKPEATTAEILNKNFKMVEFVKEEGFEIKNDEESTIAIGLRKNDPILSEINKTLSEISEDEKKIFMYEAMKNQPVKKINKNWFLQILKENGLQLLRGACTTLFISLVSTIVGAFIGISIEIIRTAEQPENTFAQLIFKIFLWTTSTYVEIFRGTPMIIQLVVFYYGTAQIFGFDMNKMIAALIVVSINTGSYMTEIFRGAMKAIDNGQFEAAKAIGIPHFRSMKKIILPQVIRNSLPLIGNEFVINLKDTSVLNIISVSELFFEAKTIAGQNFHFFQTFFIVSIIYFVMTFSVTQLLRKLEQKLNN
ncbi:MAG: ABC transporter substrate-binding protein/permease [Clostridiales bacterium]|jgi:putative lysine transport system permease protein|nr:ABC transporter substrate-binding protein/permease [Clostridiales bacterium]